MLDFQAEYIAPCIVACYIQVKLASCNEIHVQGGGEHPDGLWTSKIVRERGGASQGITANEHTHPSSPRKGPASVSPRGLIMVEPPAIMMPSGSLSPSMAWPSG